MNRTPIFKTSDALSGLRDSGIKSTASAIAEIVDNSIEANASKIEILAFEDKVLSGSRHIDKISEIAIYDNGIGMDKEVLELCTAVGGGNRQQRKGLGRFGYGLPNSSMSQCRRVEVYSWKDKNNVQMTYLDYDEVLRENLLYTIEPIVKDIPKKIKNNISNMSDTGTIVVWKNCDKLDVARGDTLYRHMGDDLCRIFRHYLDDDNEYGMQIEILYNVIGKNIYKLKSNDPLYIMKPNTCPGHENTPTNVMQVTKDIPVGYIDDKGNPQKTNIKFSFSTAFPDIQGLGGSSDLGKHYLKNTGISLVRKAREIDFGNFGFFDGQEARERWWGCEIRFEPELDELFGLTNNKQYALKFTYEDDAKNRDKFGEDEYSERLKTDFGLQLRRNISKEFDNVHSPQIKIIKKRFTGTGTTRGAGKTSSDIANEVLKDNNSSTRSFVEGQGKTNEEIREEWKKLIQEKDPELTTEELMKQIDEEIKKNKKIDISFGDWPGEQFFTVEITGETAIAKINRDHPYYSDFYLKLLDKDDGNDVKTVDLLLMSFARMEDEEYSMRDNLLKVRTNWGSHLFKFLEALKNS